MGAKNVSPPASISPKVAFSIKPVGIKLHHTGEGLYFWEFASFLQVNSPQKLCF